MANGPNASAFLTRAKLHRKTLPKSLLSSRFGFDLAPEDCGLAAPHLKLPRAARSEHILDFARPAHRLLSRGVIVREILAEIDFVERF